MEEIRYCKIKYNDVVLDDKLKNYMTINVEGRGLTAPTLKLVDIEGSDGDYIESEKYPSKDIKVYFVFYTKNNKERLELEEDLNLILQTDQEVKFSFDDEKGYRIGILSQAESIKYDYFTGVGSFTIHCSKPFRYLDEVTQKGENIKIDYKEKHFKIDWISFEFENTGKEFEIKNTTTGEKIKVSNIEKLTGKVIVSKDKITINGGNVSEKLDYTVSTWKKFKVSNGDNIEFVGVTNPIIKYRGVML